MIRAFTVQYIQISNKLTTPIFIIGSEKQVKDVALWDTGATCSCISTKMVNDLGLIATGLCTINTPTGHATKNVYMVDIVLPNNVRVCGVPVTESEIGQQGLGLLIGMDIISLGDFSVSNFNGKTTFGFRIPSAGEIDFVKESSRAASVLNKINKNDGEASAADSK